MSEFNGKLPSGQVRLDAKTLASISKTLRTKDPDKFLLLLGFEQSQVKELGGMGLRGVRCTVELGFQQVDVRVSPPGVLDCMAGRTVLLTFREAGNTGRWICVAKGILDRLGATIVDAPVQPIGQKRV
jgi:hypothetical protein